jgi:hypothetical protein
MWNYWSCAFVLVLLLKVGDGGDVDESAAATVTYDGQHWKVS